ncbi:MAG: uroporphyrinogen decarboxylase family protein [Brevinematales bacterium]|jgi:uroporphyrinogen decarboxylase
MTSKEIISKTIRFEKTPRLPYAILACTGWAFNRNGITLEQVLSRDLEESAELIKDSYRDLKSDMIWPDAGYNNLSIRSIGGKLKFRVRGSSDVEEVLIKNLSDIDKIDLDRLEDDPGINLLSDIGKYIYNSIGDNELIGSHSWGPFTLAGLVYGVENVMRGIYKDKSSIHSLLEFTTELCYRYLDYYVGKGAVSIVCLAEPNASGDMISKEQFRDFSMPYLKIIAERFKKKGIIVALHICGNTYKILDLIPETGAQIMSLDYKVELDRAREALGGKVAFAGNVNPVGVLQDETPDGVARAGRKCIEKAGTAPGFILMPGCEIPPTVPLENARALAKTAQEYYFN